MISMNEFNKTKKHIKTHIYNNYLSKYLLLAHTFILTLAVALTKQIYKFVNQHWLNASYIDVYTILKFETLVMNIYSIVLTYSLDPCLVALCSKRKHTRKTERSYC